MNVGELSKLLKKYPEDMLVVMSSDEEGNSFRVLAEVSDGYNFDPRERDIALAKLTKELEEMGYTEEDVNVGESCIVLYP